MNPLRLFFLDGLSSINYPVLHLLLEDQTHVLMMMPMVLFLITEVYLYFGKATKNENKNMDKCNLLSKVTSTSGLVCGQLSMSILIALINGHPIVSSSSVLALFCFAVHLFGWTGPLPQIMLVLKNLQTLKMIALEKLNTLKRTLASSPCYSQGLKLTSILIALVKSRPVISRNLILASSYFAIHIFGWSEPLLQLGKAIAKLKPLKFTLSSSPNLVEEDTSKVGQESETSHLGIRSLALRMSNKVWSCADFIVSTFLSALLPPRHIAGLSDGLKKRKKKDQRPPPIPWRSIYALCALMLLTGSSGAEVPDKESNKPFTMTKHPPSFSPQSSWEFLVSHLPTWTDTLETHEALCPTQEGTEKPQHHLLRGGPEVDPYSRSLKLFDLPREYGKPCKSNDTCFTNYCSDEGTCSCNHASDCWGCTSTEYPCLRVESSSIFKICRIGANTLDKHSRPRSLDLCSAGGKVLAQGSESLSKLLIGDSQDPSEIQCTEFLPFLDFDSNDTSNFNSWDTCLPPAFVQANVVAGIEDIYEIVLVGDLMYTLAFLDEDWVSNLYETSPENGPSRVSVPIWPRQSSGTLQQGTTRIIEVSGQETFNFSIPEGHGVEFIGSSNNDTVLVQGDLIMQGRLSFKNVTVSFEDGSINATGPMVFIESTLTNIYRCPTSFREIGGRCFFATSFPYSTKESDDACQYYGGYVPTLEELNSLSNTSQVANTLLSKGESMFISPTDNSCELVDSDGQSIKPSDSIDESDTCESQTRVLCASAINEAIVGRKYATYFSNTHVSSHKELYRRLGDPDLVPINIGSILTVTQEDGYEEDLDGNWTALEYEISDEPPVALSVIVNLVYGNEEDIHVALDSFDTPSLIAPHTWDFNSSTDALPEKIQIHTNGTVCVSSVELLFRNSTGVDHVALRIPASLFDECLDYNVCNENSTYQLSSQSLVFSDHDSGCILLGPEGAYSYMRDLTFNTLSTECNRLTSWNHPSLIGEPFMVEMDRDFNATEDIELSELSSDWNHYIFDIDSPLQLPLDEVNKLPTKFRLLSSDGGVVKSVSLTRYNKNISRVDFSSLWECINICSAVANSSGLILRDNMTELAILDLVAEIECRKVEQIISSNGTEDGREVCTSPTQTNVTSVAEVDVLMSSLLTPESYRTLSVSISQNLEDSDTVIIPTNQGLSISMDWVNAEEAAISGTVFNVSWMGELYLYGPILNGSTTVNVASEGLVDISSSVISMTSQTPPFLSNKGEATFTSVNLTEDTLLTNLEGGQLVLTYVEFLNSSTWENIGNAATVLTFPRFYDSYSVPSQSRRRLSEVGTEDQIDFEDATRHYYALNETDDLCQGGDDPDRTVEGISAAECMDLCEEETVCSGILVYLSDGDVDVTNCDLCLRESNCSFDCSTINNEYYKPVSNFDYTKVSACLALPRKLAVEPVGVTLEECKAYCSWYRSCEGYHFNITTETCSLYADLDFGNCTSYGADEIIINIPYIPEESNYLLVEGELLDNQDQYLAAYSDKDVSECSALCDKTLYCKSFYGSESGGNCTLYASNTFHRSQNFTAGLYISVDEIFPKKRYMFIDTCPVEEAFAEYNGTKTQQRCQSHCDNNLGCHGFTFEPFLDHNTTNCWLHDRVAIIDEVFEEKGECNDASVSIAYATESFVANSLSYFTFTVVSSAELEEDQCKSLCLYDDDCVALRYASFDNSTNATNSSLCEVGYLSAVTLDDIFDDDYDDILVLQAKSSDLGSSYLPTPACYTGEPLDTPNITTVNQALGYTHLPLTCTNASPIYSPTNISSPSNCGLLCDETYGCGGFIHYINYTGSMNQHKIGRCELIGGAIEIGVCDAVEYNSDVWLRADLGSVCEAVCNAHELCSSYVPHIQSADTGEVSCELYSDIALLDVCELGENKTSVHIGLSYRERDALVEAKEQCFIEFEDIAEIGCFGPSFPAENTSFSMEYIDTVTPHHCQQACKLINKPFYAVSEGTNCYCTSSDTFYSDYTSSTNCTTTCDGDSYQTCGGTGYAMIGSTDLPTSDITLSQCKRKCFEDQKCEAIVYNESSSECELRSSALFKTTCGNIPADTRLFIESLEHFYEAPEYSYVGNATLHVMSTDYRFECQKMCDVFRGCEAIHYDYTTYINNCELLGGDIVRLGTNETAEGVLVARDVTLFTEGFWPESSMLTNFTVFDTDECRALCEAHSECGGIVFGNQSCSLYPSSGFSNVNISSPSATPHYVDYHIFVDPQQDFAEASKLCIDDEGGTLPTPLNGSSLTAQSSHDCAARCNSVSDCVLFTYDETQSSDCLLYEDVNLKDSCDGSVSTFVMYTRGKFTEPEENQSPCLLDEDILSPKLMYRKSLVECAALCDSWFLCRSFRSDQETGECRLYDDDFYSVDFCNDTTPNGDLYVYYSDFLFVRLGENFCVASNSQIGDELEVPLEACKAICEKLSLCVALEHHEGGSCLLYSSSDFSVPCESTDDKTLYISYQDVVDSMNDQTYSYKPMEQCFNLTGSDWQTVASEDECAYLCGEDCLGYQYNSTHCNLVSDTLPSISVCDPGESFSFRVERYPYQKMNNTCLLNDIYDGDADEYRLYNKQLYECIALCDAHPYCRYFLYGTDPNSDSPALRECKLFMAQAQELDCDEISGSNPTGNYSGLEAYVNGRTFVDQITWFGEPESTYATIPGLSYQDCASLCDSLDNAYCSAFLHTWNYRRSSSSVQPQIFTKTRIIRASFNSEDDIALFLQVYDDDSGNLTLTMSTSDAGVDDDLKKQRLSDEWLGGNYFNMKFWQYSGQCLSAGEFSELPDGSFTRDVLHDQLKSIPTCQSVYIDECDADGTIQFEKVAYLDELNPGRFALAYNLPNQGASDDAVGCLGVEPMPGNDSWEQRGSISDEIIIPAEINCTEVVTSINCTRNTTSFDNGTSIENVTTWSPEGCNATFVDSDECTPGNEQIEIPWDFYTIENSTLCINQTVLVEECAVTIEVITYETNITTEVSWNETNVTADVSWNETNFTTEVFTWNETTTETICHYTTVETNTTCWTKQRTPLDLLNTTLEHFESASECQPPFVSAQKTRSIFSRTYGLANCGYDDDVAVFTAQLFAFASDPVVLSNDATSLCLDDDLSLIDCSTATEWTHIFGYEDTDGGDMGGEIFYDVCDDNGTDCHHMKCLTRESDINSTTIFIQPCNSNASLQQRWTYDGDNGLLEEYEPDSYLDTRCIIANSTLGSIHLGDCLDPSARWSQYSECKLNTRVKTKPMKVESIELGTCLADDAASLIDCSGASEWEYYYDSNEARLQLVSDTNQTVCLARQAPVNDNGASNLTDLPTGVESCDSSKLPYWLTFLEGEEQNIFMWANTDYDGSGFVPKDPKYCIEVPQDPQEECDSDLDKEMHWRRYDTIVDATEISVKPSLLLNKVTDPEAMYQLFLFTAEGKAIRILKAKTAGLERGVSQIIPVIDSVVETASLSLASISTATDLVGTFTSKANTVEDSFKTFALILKPFTYVPYVGTALKVTRLSTICSQIASRIKDGTRLVDKADDLLDVVIGPIASFLSVLQTFSDSLETSILFLKGLVEFVARTAFCAYIKGDDMMDHYDRMQAWVTALLQKVGEAVGILSDLRTNYLGLLDGFRGDMNLIIKEFKRFLSILSGLTSFSNKLSFLRTLASLKACVSFPIVGKKCITLKDFGKVMNQIEKAIKNIPLVGDAWKAAEKLAGSVLEKIFKFIGISLPSFKVKIYDLKDALNDAVSDIFDIMGNFEGIGFDVMGTDFFEDAIADVKENIPEGFLDFDFDCANVTCVKDMFTNNLGIDLPDLDADFPSISMNGLNFTMPNVTIDLIDTVMDTIADFRDDFVSLLEGGIQCNSYETMSVNVIEYLRASLNMSEGDIQGIPDCSMPFEICADLTFPLWDEFTSSVANRTAALGLDDIDIRRRLGDIEDFNEEFLSFDNWGLAFSLDPIPQLASEALRNSIFKLSSPIRNSDFVEDFKTPAWATSFKTSVKKAYDQLSQSKGGQKVGNWFSLNPPTLGRKWKNIEVDLVKLFDYGVKLVIGKGGGVWQVKLRVGGFLKSGFTAKSNWFASSYEAKLAVDEDQGDFQEEANTIEGINEISCKLDYFETTRNVLKQPYFNTVALGLDLNVDSLMEEVYEIIDQRNEDHYDTQNEGVRRRTFALCLAKDACASTFNLPKVTDTLKLVRKKMNTDIRTRATLAAYMKTQDVSQTYADFEEIFLDAKPAEAPLECVGAESAKAWTKKTKAWGKLREIFADKEGLEEYFLRTSENTFFSDFKSKVKTIEWHPTSFKNLFGAKMAVTIGRDALLGNSQISKTGVKTLTKGPLWISKNDEYTPRVDQAFSDFAPWSALEFLWKWYKQAFRDDGRNANAVTKKSLLYAMIDAGEIDERDVAKDLAFAERVTAKFEWSFFSMVITIMGDAVNANPADLSYCKGTVPNVCVGVGLNAENYIDGYGKSYGDRRLARCDKHCNHHLDNTQLPAFHNHSNGPAMRLLPAVKQPVNVQARSGWRITAMVVAAASLLSLILVLHCMWAWSAKKRLQ